MERIKTPVSVEGSFGSILYDVEGKHICHAPGSHMQSEPIYAVYQGRLEEIALALNAHDAMVAVCELAVEVVENDLPGARELLCSSAKIILALVKGGTGE